MNTNTIPVVNTNKVSKTKIYGGYEQDDVYESIAVCAYFIAEQRGFSPEHELDDWLEAEKEIKKQNFYKFQT